MKRLFLFILLVPVGAVVIWSMGGCGARTEVAVGKVAEQIDDLLGRLDVKRAEIKRSLATLKQGQTGLLRARIRAQVKQDQLQRKMEPIERRMSDIDESLDVLREHLADGTPAELAGKTYPVYGLISKIIDETLGSVVVELNFSIEVKMNVWTPENLEVLKERAFDPGIFVVRVLSCEEDLSMECESVIFGRRQEYSA